MGKSYLCAVFKALLEFLGRKPNTSATNALRAVYE